MPIIKRRSKALHRTHQLGTNQHRPVHSTCAVVGWSCHIVLLFMTVVFTVLH
jgi:hypothetical protein